MIVVTGAGGFIGSAVVWMLNNRGISDCLAVDTQPGANGYLNLKHVNYATYLGHEEFVSKLEQGTFDSEVEGIIHMGACSDTTEGDWEFLKKNNFEYTKRLARWAVKNGKRFVYASSGATYGDGKSGFSDEHSVLKCLKPLNLYGESKHLFDLWACQRKLLGRIAGLKYFNVYGPNEYHKGAMRSMVHKSFCQILETGTVKLFKSSHPDYGDGEQLRDFIYIKDAVGVTLFVYDHAEANGIINCGTGIPRSFNDLAKAVFRALEREESIQYIEMPENLREQYQSYTKADTEKLIDSGYQDAMQPLEVCVADYVKNYLLTENPYLKSG